jgi:pimeloyl-ACP methyl ester carboxylesterase
MQPFKTLTGRLISANGIRLNTVQSGSQEGPLVILLHGFPEFWYGWRNQLGPLADTGLRVVAPDLRGYGLSDKPEGLDAYRLDVLAEDITGLIEALGYEKASLVGHDWGGIIAWAVAALHPERVERLVILNAPYPKISALTLLLHPQQFIKSAYILFFNLPRLPEKWLPEDDWRLMIEALRKSSRNGTFGADDLRQYLWAWEQKGALTAMLNYYRALVRRPVELPDEKIAAPTLILWGKQDTALGSYLAKDSLKHCLNGQLIFFEETTHWIQHEESEAVNTRLKEFLKDN